MFLMYDEETGLAKKAYDIPVISPYIEITDKQNEQICNGEKWFVNNGKLTQEPTLEYKKQQRKIEVDSKIEELNNIAIEYAVNNDTQALEIVKSIKEGLLNSI